MPTLGIKYPAGLGRPFREVWAEIYRDLEERVASVRAGQPTWNKALLLLLERNDFRMFLRNKSMLILAAALARFHLGNGAMPPLYGVAVVHAGKGNAATFTATTVASLVATRIAASRGYCLVLLISFAALPVRGLIAGSLIEQWGVWPVQVLDGIGAGLQSVAVPGLVACLLDGSGRVNVGQGAVMTVQGIGASLSPALGGWIAQFLGYRVAFITLGSFALISLALWIGFAATLRPACDGTRASR